MSCYIVRKNDFWPGPRDHAKFRHNLMRIQYNIENLDFCINFTISLSIRLRNGNWFSLTKYSSFNGNDGIFHTKDIMVDFSPVLNSSPMQNFGSIGQKVRHVELLQNNGKFLLLVQFTSKKQYASILPLHLNLILLGSDLNFDVRTDYKQTWTDGRTIDLSRRYFEALLTLWTNHK